MVGPIETPVPEVAPQPPEPRAGHGSAPTAVSLAYDALMAFVRNAPAGTRLPPERELAARLGVSRTTLRSATDRLALLGYVSVRHGAGTVTRTPGPRHLAAPFGVAVADVPGSIDEVLALRLIIEPPLAALAAGRADAVALRGLREAAGGADAVFHELLASSSGNALAAQLVGVLIGLSVADDSCSSAERGTAARVVARQHAAVVEAVAEGDRRLAHDSMRLHLRWEARRLTANSH